jgi:hypothetical protein
MQFCHLLKHLLLTSHNITTLLQQWLVGHITTNVKRLRLAQVYNSKKKSQNNNTIELTEGTKTLTKCNLFDVDEITWTTVPILNNKVFLKYIDLRSKTDCSLT